MAATQLARQLAALQTDTRAATKGGRASVLFTSREAEGYDVASLQALGRSGLAELAEGDARYAAFEETLFSDAWRARDRETAEPAFSAEVNAEVARFLRLLCCAFLSKPAAKALEYLVRRFKVHVYNIDALLACALPYHDSLFFGRVVQILEVGGANAGSGALGPGSASAPVWAFLAGCKATGTPLPRSLLVGQAVKDGALLRFVGAAAAEAAAAGAAGDCDPSPFLSFYAVLLAELASRSPGGSLAAPLPEPLLAALLQLGLRGVKDTACPPHQAAGHLLVSALSARVPLARAPFDALASALVRHVRWSEGGAAGGDDDANDAAALDGGDDSDVPSEGASAALAAAVALFAGQASHQGLSGAAAVGAVLSGSASSSSALTWLPAYRLGRKPLKPLTAHSRAVAAALAGLAGRFDASAFTAVYVASCLDYTAGAPSSSLSAPAVTAVRHLLAALPRTQATPYVRGAVASLAGVYAPVAAAVDANDADTGAAATLAALSSLLLFASQAWPEATDAGLAAAFAAAGEDGAAALKAWVADVLAGTQHDLVVVTSTSAASGKSAAATSGSSAQRDASSGVSLSLALSHASAHVRSQATGRLRDMAAAYVADVRAAADGGDDAGGDDDEDAAGESLESRSPKAARLAAARSFLVTALDRAADDADEPSVAAAALRIHGESLSAGVALAAGDDSQSVAADDGAAPSHTAAAGGLLALAALEAVDVQAQSVLRRWGPASSSDAGASGAVASALALLSGPLAAAAHAHASSPEASPEDAARAFALLDAATLATLQRLPIGAEPAPPAGSAAAAVRDAALAAAASLAHRHPLFAAFTLAQSSNDKAAPAPTVALAHGVLRQLLAATVAGAAAPAQQQSALGLLLTAASASPAALQATHGVSPHHGGRGRWVALAALDAAEQSLGATAAAVAKGGDTAEVSLAALASDVAIAAAVDANAAPSTASGGKKGRKGSLAAASAAAPLALTADDVTAALSSLLTAISPVLRDEWRAVTGALAALTESKRAAVVAKAVRKAKAAAQAAATPAAGGVASQAAAAVADAASAAAAHAASTLQPSRLHAHTPAPGTGASASAAPPAGGDNAPVAVVASDPHRHLYVGIDEQAGLAAEAPASASEPRLRARGSLLLSLLHRCATGTLHVLRASGDAGDGVDLATPLLVPASSAAPVAVLTRSLARTLALLLLGAHPSAMPFESLAPTAYAVINGCYPHKPTAGGVDAVASPRSPLALLLALVAAGPTVLPPAASLRAVQLLRASVAATVAAASGGDAAPRAAALAALALPPLFALLSTPSPSTAQIDAPLVTETRTQALAAVADVLTAVAAAPASPKTTHVALLTAFYATSDALAPGVAPACAAPATAALVAAGARLVEAAADVTADAAAADRVIASAADGVLPGVLAAHAAACVAVRPAAAAVLLRLAVSAAASTTAQQAAVQGAAASPASAAALVWAPAASLIAGAPAYITQASTRAGQAAVLLTALTVARAAASEEAHAARLLPLVLASLRSLPHAVPLVRDGSTSPSGESAPLLPAALAVVTPALWAAACATPASQLASAAVDASAAAVQASGSTVAALAADSSGSATGGDLLLARLIALIERGPAPASTAARAALASVGGAVTPTHLVRYLRASGLVAEGASTASAAAGAKGGKARRARASSVSGGASAEEAQHLDDGAALALVPSALRFRHALAVGRKLHALLRPAAASADTSSTAALSPAEVWVGRATLVAEVAASALNAAAAAGSLRVSDAAALVGPVSSLAEVLLALPEAAAAAATAAAAAPSAGEDAAMAEPGAAASSAASGGEGAAPAPSGVTWSDEDLPSACEYGLQAALGVLQAVAGAVLATASSSDASAEAADGFDVDLVLAAVKGSSSLHTRGAALGLLGSLARLAPGRTLNRLLPVLLSVGSSALPRDDAYTLSLLGKLVGTVVPPLAAHGRALGVSVHGLLHVFALCAPLVSPHRQGGLFGSLLSSVGAATAASAASSGGSAAKAAYAALAADSARYLPSLTALLLAQPVLAAAAASGAASPTTGGTSAAALAALPSLCGALFKPFSPSQQVDALAALIATAHTLLRPASAGADDGDDDGDASTVVSDAPGDAGSDDEDGEAADPTTHLAAALSRLQSADARNLAPLLVAGRSALAADALLPTAGGETGASTAAGVTGAAMLRFRVGTALLDFVGSHLKSRPFLLAAAMSSPASEGLQPHFLLLAERLFDELSEAAEGRERAVTARAAALAAARAATEAATAAEAAPAAAAAASTAGGKKRKSSAGGVDPAVAAAEARATATAASRSAESLAAQARFWGGRYEQAYALLGGLAGLVAPSTFVTLISALLGHPSGGIRRRSLAFLNEYLRDVYGSAAGSAGSSVSIGPSEAPLYLELLGELTRVVAAGALPAGHTARAALLGDEEGEGEGDGGDGAEGNAAVYAQVALDTVALLGGYLGRAHPAEFGPVIGVVMEAVRLPLPPASAALAAASSANAAVGAALAVRSSALLCVASLAGPLGPRLLPHLPALLPAALTALEWTVPAAASSTAPLSEPAAALRLSVLAALTRLVEALPSFIHPFLPRLLPTVVHPAVDGSLPLPPRCVRYDRRVPLPGADEAASAAALGADSKEERAALPPGVPAAAAVTGVGAAAENDNAAAPTGAAALPFSLAPASASAAPPSSASLAAALLSRLTALLPPRLLLPPLLGAWGTVAAPGVTTGGSSSSVAAAVRLTRAVCAVLPRLSKKDVKEHTPRLLRFVMGALDGRWRAVQPAALAAVVAAPAAPATAPAASALAAAAASASVVEAEVGCLFAALALRLSEASLRPLLLRLLTWGTAAPEDIRAELLLTGESDVVGDDDDDDAEGNGSGTASLVYAHAALARCISLFRLIEALTAVTKSLALPFYGGLLLPEVLRELNASAAAVGAWNAAAAAKTAQPPSAAAKAAATPAAAKATAATTATAATAGSKRKPAHESTASSARKRVRFAGAGDDSSDDDDSEDEDAGSSDDGEEDGGSDAGANDGEGGPASALAAAGAATSVPYSALFPLDAAPWAPAAVHEPPSGGAPHALVPTSPHGLRCVALGCLKAALHHDAASTTSSPTDAHGVTTGAGLMARGGRDRLEGVLRALTACFELPLAASAEEGDAAATAPSTASKKGGKKAAAATPAPLSTTSAPLGALTSAGVPGGHAGYDSFVAAYLIPSVAGAVTATGRDALWKPIVNGALLLTRDGRPRVRLAGLRAAGAAFAAGGDAALVLLPEALPFLGESVHDGDGAVEAAAQGLLSELEARSGEDLQQYLA